MDDPEVGNRSRSGQVFPKNRIKRFGRLIGVDGTGARTDTTVGELDGISGALLEDVHHLPEKPLGVGGAGAVELKDSLGLDVGKLRRGAVGGEGHEKGNKCGGDLHLLSRLLRWVRSVDRWERAEIGEIGGRKI